MLQQQLFCLKILFTDRKVSQMITLTFTLIIEDPAKYHKISFKHAIDQKMFNKRAIDTKM